MSALSTTTFQARARYTRDPELFVATRSGGGGFIRFAGFFRNWKWVRKNCVCAECGAILGEHKSSEHADGLVRGAVYFDCLGSGRHVIRRESDLRWQIGSQERDERLRAKGEVKDVQEAYHWLKAAPDDDNEEVNF
jgi:hypothetical protein